MSGTRNSVIRWLAISAVMLVAACGADDADDATATPSSEPNATAASAPTRTMVPGITREAGGGTPVPPSGPPSAETVAFPEAFPHLESVDRPVGMVEMPGHGRFLLILQAGHVLSFANDEGATELSEVLDWRDRVRTEGSEEGLLGIALSPTFEDDGYVYLYYIASEGERRSIVSRFEVAGEGENLRIEPDSELIILEVPQPFDNHNGGQLAFGPDGMLYIALGDGGAGGDPHGNGQNRGTLLGSILRIDVRNAREGEPYRIPDDNPLVSASDARGEVWAYGFRNPWRFSFDMEDDTMWAADVGESTREEINRVEAGGNYGWNVMEGFTCFTSSDCDAGGFELPVVDYARDGGHCSVTGGYVGRGEAAGTLTGYYVYGDYCSGTVWAIPADAEAGSQPEPIELRGSGSPLPSFAQDLAGQIYILSFDGRIYRVDG